MAHKLLLHLYNLKVTTESLTDLFFLQLPPSNCKNTTEMKNAYAFSTAATWQI